MESKVLDSQEQNRFDKTAEEVVQHYNDRLDYDVHLTPDYYRGPKMVAECVRKYLKDKMDQKILDVAAGSGKVGAELSKLGYTKLDALEPAQVLFGNSPNKALYTKYMSDLLKPDTVLDVPDDYYDAVTIVGGIAVGLVPAGALFEMIRIVKPGGFIMNIMREEHLVNGSVHENMDSFTQELERKGKWEIVERTIMPDYLKGRNGVLFVFEVKESGCARYESEILKKYR